MANKKPMKVGETRIVMRTITRTKGGTKKKRAGTATKRKERRKCYVTKMRGGKYKVRLVSPKANSAGRDAKGKLKYNKGQSWTKDQKHFNRSERYEVQYKNLFGRKGLFS